MSLMRKFRGFGAISAGERWVSRAVLCLIVSSLAGCASSSHVTNVEDAKIAAAVRSEIGNHPDLGPPNQIYVDARSDVVYLSGTVDTGLALANAQQIASRVPGVKRVVSTIGIEK